MDSQQLLIFVIIIGVAYAAFCSHRAKSRVYCTFVRRDKTVGHKWALAKNGERIEFGGGWYYVVMERVTLEALDSGLNMLFPTMIRRLDFTYGKSSPRDPQTGGYDWETPEARKNLSKREDIEALELGSQKALGKAKGGAMGGWLPIALIVGMVVIGYFVYQMSGQIDAVGRALNVLQEMQMNR